MSENSCRSRRFACTPIAWFALDRSESKRPEALRLSGFSPEYPQSWKLPADRRAHARVQDYFVQSRSANDRTECPCYSKEPDDCIHQEGEPAYRRPRRLAAPVAAEAALPRS